MSTLLDVGHLQILIDFIDDLSGQCENIIAVKQRNWAELYVEADGQSPVYFLLCSSKSWLFFRLSFNKQPHVQLSEVSMTKNKQIFFQKMRTIDLNPPPTDSSPSILTPVPTVFRQLGKKPPGKPTELYF